MAYDYKPREIEVDRQKYLNLGEGKISGYLALFLGVFSFLAVLCYLFPSYLTTPELRATYDADFLQQVLKYGMYFALVFSFLNFCLAKTKKSGAVGFVFTCAAFAMGGYQLETGPVEVVPLSFGLDWLILAFVVSAILFIFIEKIFPKYREQAIFRPGWRLDFVYFCFNHLLITVLLLAGNYFVTRFFSWAVSSEIQVWIRSLPLVAQVVLLIICADFVLYWSHRAFHEVSFLWKFHAVHHSVEYMDWMAGSRNHVVQTLVDRCFAMLPLYLLGTTKEALDIYVAFAAFQAVYVHANVGIPLGPIKYILATPQYHHWHHSSDEPAIDTNYSVHTPLFDKLFGTYHMPSEHWPAHYGTTKPIPKTFFAQLIYPFRKDE